MQYIVNLSSGLSSTEAAERTISKVGRENTILLFADVKGTSTSEHAGEDADNYRFLADTERYFDVPIIRIVEGRDIWQVMFDARAMVLPVGTTRLARCSIELKREPIDAWIAARYAPNECIRVTGLGWREPHRIAAFDRMCAPYETWHPLNEPPYIDNCMIEATWAARGIRAPRLYEQGFEHANCGGFAEIYDKTSILRDRRDGETKSMTLYEFAERLDHGEKYDQDDWGGCGCFSQTPQLRMDDLLLETDIKRTSP